MKKLFTIGVIGSLLFSPIAISDAASTNPAGSPKMRYFMQQKNVQGSKTPYGDNPAAGRYVTSGDARIYYEVYGRGAPVFVFHGGGVGTPYEMGAILDRLVADFRVIVVSTRGHGHSEIGHEPLSYEQKAADMVAVMRNVTDEPATIIGFSDGAYSAYKVAAMHPRLVSRIVAIGAGTLEKGFFKEDSLDVEAIEKLDKDFIDQQRKMMPEPYRLSEFWKAYGRFWSEMEAGADLFGAIRCPVLLIAGDEDDHAPIITMVRAHQLIPNSRLCIVPKAWHTAFLDAPEITWAAMDGFIHADAGDLAPSKKVDYNSRK